MGFSRYSFLGDSALKFTGVPISGHFFSGYLDILRSGVITLLLTMFGPLFELWIHCVFFPTTANVWGSSNLVQESVLAVVAPGWRLSFGCVLFFLFRFYSGKLSSYVRCFDVSWRLRP